MLSYSYSKKKTKFLGKLKILVPEILVIKLKPGQNHFIFHHPWNGRIQLYITKKGAMQTIWSKSEYFFHVTSCQPKGEEETIYSSSRIALISSWNNVGVAGILSLQEMAQIPAKTAADNMWGPKVTVQIAYRNNCGMCHVTDTWGTLE